MGKFWGIVVLLTFIGGPVTVLTVGAAVGEQEVVLGIVGIGVPVIVAIIAAAASTRREEKRREAVELKRLQKDEQAKWLEAELQARKRKSEKAEWLRQERTRWEREERDRKQAEERRRQIQIALFGPSSANHPQTALFGNYPRTEKHLLYGNQEDRCTGCCGLFPFRNMTIDHVVPQANGGTDRISNLQLLCNACNSMKGTGTQEKLIVRLIQDGIRTG